jgi:GST-like protein
MIDLYTWGTPNGRKISVMLEELGEPYNVKPINISKDEQFAPDFLKISPNNKIPALVDTDGPTGQTIALFESGAILVYLAEKYGRFLPVDPVGRLETLQWLMFQMASVGPMFGQAHHFMRFAPEKVPYAIKRYGDETRRIYGVMDKRLGESEHLAGPAYTIADIATFPWVSRYEFHQVDLAEFPRVKAWFDRIAARPAVVRGMAVPKT